MLLKNRHTNQHYQKPNLLVGDSNITSFKSKGPSLIHKKVFCINIQNGQRVSFYCIQIQMNVINGCVIEFQCFNAISLFI